MSGVTEPSVRVQVVATGLVQGVWFRHACREAAREEGLGGWVRNRADGAVEAELEGPPDAVDRLVAWFRTGPPQAQVESVDVTSVPTTGDARFRIR
jgi:acylphosphatase